MSNPSCMFRGKTVSFTSNSLVDPGGPQQPKEPGPKQLGLRVRELLVGDSFVGGEDVRERRSVFGLRSERVERLLGQGPRGDQSELEDRSVRVRGAGDHDACQQVDLTAPPLPRSESEYAGLLQAAQAIQVSDRVQRGFTLPDCRNRSPGSCHCLPASVENP